MEPVSTIITGIIASLSAHVVQSVARALGEKVTKKSINTCLERGLKAVESAIDAGQTYQRLAFTQLRTLFTFDPAWTGDQMVKLFKYRTFDRRSLRDQFGLVGGNPATFPGIEFDRAMDVFAAAFLDAAAADPKLQNWIRTLNQLRQTELLEQQSPDARSLDQLERYLTDVSRKINVLPWAPIHETLADANRDEAPGLAEIYTDLNTKRHRSFEREDEFRQFMREPKDERPVSALEALNTDQRLLLLGDPGSGKSTFLKYVTHLLARARLADDPGELLARLDPWSHGALVPVWIELRHFAEFIGKREFDDDAAVFRLYLDHWLQQHKREYFTETLHRLIDAEEPLLFLLDGLDEASSEMIGRVVRHVNDLVAACPQHRFVVSCRPYAYIGCQWELAGFQLATLAPFAEDQIRRFIVNWYERLQDKSLPAEECSEKAETLSHAAIHREDLRRMAERPLLLTVMAQLHTFAGALPEDRTELYAGAVNLLLQRWGRGAKNEKGVVELLEIPNLKMSDLEAALYKAAFEAHRQSDGKGADTADLKRGDLLEWMSPFLGGSQDKTVDFIRHISNRAGLLIPHGTDSFTFPHRSFQEFLAARHLLTQNDYPGEAAQLLQQDRGLWREVFVLAAGRAARDARLSTALAAVNQICPADHDLKSEASAEQWEDAEIACQALCEIGLHSLARNDLGPLLRQRVQGWLVAGLRADEFLPPKRRCELAPQLLKIGDPRPGILEVDSMEFCLIPGGDCWLDIKADTPRDGGELFDGLKHDYWMARFPVTVAQFRQFVDETDFEPGDEDSIREPHQQAVRWVDWNEARRFCEWLTERWRENGWLPTGWSARLPTEQEWEKAARGGVKRVRGKEKILRISDGPVGLAAPTLCGNKLERAIYPWGDDANEINNRCNMKDSGIGGAAPVGCFPSGRSITGCEEMAGNLWEWTNTAWGENPQEQTNSRRKLCGGAYWNDKDGVGCSARFRLNPSFRDGSLGFRVSLSPFSGPLVSVPSDL